MNESASRKFGAILLVLGVCVSGYLTSSTKAASPSGTVTIYPSVILQQGNGVTYSFANTISTTSISIGSTSITIGSLTIGATTTSGALSNILMLLDSSQTLSWSATSTDPLTTVQYSFSGEVGLTYRVSVDGQSFALVSTNPSSMASFNYTGWFSAHSFSISPSPANSATLQASFSYTLSGQELHCTDQSYGAVTDWVWNFGDGSGSSSQSPSHYYLRPGEYTISLTVYDSNLHSSVASKTISVGSSQELPKLSGLDWNLPSLHISVTAYGMLFAGLAMWIMSMVPNAPQIIFTRNGWRIVGMILILVSIFTIFWNSFG